MQVALPLLTWALVFTLTCVDGPQHVVPTPGEAECRELEGAFKRDRSEWHDLGYYGDAKCVAPGDVVKVAECRYSSDDEWGGM